MKTLPICVFIGICFIMKGASETINCYVCDNCDVLDDSQLRTCPFQESTNSPPITNEPTILFTDSTTQSTEESTSGINTGTPLEIISTTVSPKPTQIVTDPPQTEEPITETPKPETTNTKTEPTEITNRPTTNAGKETTTTKPSETEITTNNIVESAETLRPFTNDIPEALEPSSEVTTKKTDPVEQTVSSPAAQAPSMSFKPDTVNSTVPASIVQSSLYEQPYQIFNRLPRGIRNSRSAPSYHCYSIVIIDGDAKKVNKGCVEVPEEKAACYVLENQFGKSIDKCKICTVDKCNSCSTLKYSVITLVMVLVISFYSVIE